MRSVWLITSGGVHPIISHGRGVAPLLLSISGGPRRQTQRRLDHRPCRNLPGRTAYLDEGARRRPDRRRRDHAGDGLTSLTPPNLWASSLRRVRCPLLHQLMEGEGDFVWM